MRRPLPVKKVQDDLGFDVTQGEVVGNVFPNASMIRVVQAAAVAGMRDSVPPSSALRFDPNSASYQTRKRERDYSFGSDGQSPSSPEASNKRQRVLGINPDQPVPSREQSLQNGISGHTGPRCQDDRIIEDSQQGVSLGLLNGTGDPLLDRARVPETPPPGRGRDGIQLQNGANSRLGRKSEDPILPAHARPAIPKVVLGGSESHAKKPPKSDSRNNHISKATEPPSSLPNAAKSPNPILPSAVSATNRKASSPILPPKMNGKASTKSLSEEAVYDDFGSNSKAEDISRSRKEILKIRSSPKPGLPGLERANDRTHNTPPNRRRETSSSREQSTSISGQFALTPGSREREKKERRKASEGARSAGKAAAEVADGKEAQIEQERRATEKAAEEKAAKEKAAKNAAKEKVAKEKATKETAATEKAEGQRLQREKAKAEAFKQQQERGAKARADKVAAEEKARSLKRVASSESSQARSASPAVSRGTLSARPQSSTSFFPTGRKPALKSSGSSSSLSVTNSSPVLTRASPRASGIDAAMPLPDERRVSFTDQIQDLKKTPTPRVEPPTPNPSGNSKPAGVYAGCGLVVGAANSFA